MTVNKYIIYVEDDPDDVLLLQDAFREVPGYELEVLEHGAALLHFLERALCFPDLIILDINMPVLNGHETLRALKQHPLYQQIPVVLFSTGSNPGELLFAASYHTDLIVKPYDYASLRQSVRRLLAYVVDA
ncbi:MAG: response regulator [Chitinophagaceae bacterium]|nr:MAG: response regulator [Chitinophagaceae bacterium]